MRRALLKGMMEMVVGRLLIGALLMQAMACDSAIIIPRMRGDMGVADATTDTAAVDTGTVDPLLCLSGQLPPRPAMEDGDDGMEHVFVFVDWELFPETSNFGYNLDQRCTSGTETASCTSDSVISDEERGVDNAFAARVVPGARDYFMMLMMDPQADLWALQRKGVVNLLVRVRGWNGTSEDHTVEVDFMQTVCGHASSDSDCDPETDPATPLAFDGSDTFYVSQDSLAMSDPMQARVVQSAAYVTGGLLVAPVPDEAALRFPVDAGYVDVGLQDAQLTVPLPVSGRGITPGGATLSGRWSIADLQEIVAYFALCPASGDLRLNLVNSVINAAADIRDEPTDDNMNLPCNAVSGAIHMTGYAATYGGAKPQIRLPQGCP